MRRYAVTGFAVITLLLVGCSATEPAEQTGSIVTYFEEKGFGFLRPEGGGRDVFFHISRVVDSDATGLRPGVKVIFELGMDRTGKMAASSVKIATEPPASFEAWRAWWRAPAVASATLVFFGSLCLHAWVGARDVVLDYVHPLALRAAALSLIALGLGALFAWVAVILLAV